MTAAVAVDAPAVAGSPKTCCNVNVRLVASPLITGKTLMRASAAGSWSSWSIKEAISGMLLEGARTTNALMLGLVVITTPARMPEFTSTPSRGENESRLLGGVTREEPELPELPCVCWAWPPC